MSAAASVTMSDSICWVPLELAAYFRPCFFSSYGLICFYHNHSIRFDQFSIISIVHPCSQSAHYSIPVSRPFLPRNIHEKLGTQTTRTEGRNWLIWEEGRDLRVPLKTNSLHNLQEWTTKFEGTFLSAGIIKHENLRREMFSLPDTCEKYGDEESII